MAKPSNLTAGDGLSLAADVIKLLAPVLKRTDKAKLENLKRNARAVQDVFQRMLDGMPPVRDYGDPDVPAAIRHENKTDIEFDPSVFFTIDVSKAGVDNLEVCVLARRGPNHEFLEWKHEFERLMVTQRKENVFTSLETVEKTDNRPFNWIQGHLIAEAGKVTFRGKEDHGYEIEIECGSYHEIETITAAELRAFSLKGKEVLT